MSDVRMQSMVVLYWSMLAAGAGLSSLGLIRSITKFRDWRSASPEDDGEIVIGDGRLVIGQSVAVTPGAREAASAPGESVAGMITDISRSHCVLTLDRGQIASRAFQNLPGEPKIASSSNRSDNDWRRGDQISVTVTAASELFRFSARIRDVISASNGTRLVVSRPSILVRIQRRRHARVQLSVPATIERAWMLDEANGQRVAHGICTTPPVHGTVRDLSGGGLKAHVGGVAGLQQIDTLLQLFHPECTVRIRLPIPSLPEGAVLARIISSDRAVTSGGLTVSVACEFLPMPPWEQELVIQQVFQFQRENKRASRAG